MLGSQVAKLLPLPWVPPPPWARRGAQLEGREHSFGVAAVSPLRPRAAHSQLHASPLLGAMSMRSDSQEARLFPLLKSQARSLSLTEEEREPGFLQHRS